VVLIGFIGIVAGSSPNFAMIAVSVGGTTSVITWIFCRLSSTCKVSPKLWTKAFAPASFAENGIP
jgi:hypothetical protein